MLKLLKFAALAIVSAFFLLVIVTLLITAFVDFTGFLYLMATFLTIGAIIYFAICKSKIFIKIIGWIIAAILFIALGAFVGAILSNPGYLVLAFFGWALWVFICGIFTGSIGLIFSIRF